ncbi:hypothetical protein I3I95_03025 [bacterium]|nr:hypothetical protein [bacterium]
MKALAFVVCAVFWANPLVWIMRRCIARDLELACDEQVIDGKRRSGNLRYLALLYALAVLVISFPIDPPVM